MMRALLAVPGLVILAAVAWADTCPSGFDVGPPAVTIGTARNLRARLVADDGGCAFDVRLCANIGTNCVPQLVESIVGVGLAASIDTPPIDTPAACGTATPIVLTADGDRTARRRLKAVVRGADGKKRRVRLTLACKPGESPPVSSTRSPAGYSVPSSHQRRWRCRR